MSIHIPWVWQRVAKWHHQWLGSHGPKWFVCGAHAQCMRNNGRHAMPPWPWADVSFSHFSMCINSTRSKPIDWERRTAKRRYENLEEILSARQTENDTRSSIWYRPWNLQTRSLLRIHTPPAIAPATVDGVRLLQTQTQFFSLSVCVSLCFPCRVSTEFVLRDSDGLRAFGRMHTMKRQTSTFNNRTNTSTLTLRQSRSRRRQKIDTKMFRKFFNSRAIKFHSYVLFSVWLRKSEQRKL